LAKVKELNMGGGKSSGSSQTTVQMTPEQRELLATQTEFLKGTALPAYKETVGGAKDVLGQVMPAVQGAAGGASDVASRTGAAQELGGTAAYGTGLAGLASLFGPQYKEQQVQAALQAGREATREQLGTQNAMYGGAGGLGSARQALADTNLRQLGEQRQATAAATAAAGVEANRAAAAQQLASFGEQGLAGARQAAASRVGLAGAPQDIYNKYASVVYGIPQSNTTPNFAGTQGSTTKGESKGFGF
jgi:hypothetical protein